VVRTGDLAAGDGDEQRRAPTPRRRVAAASGRRLRQLQRGGARASGVGGGHLPPPEHHGRRAPAAGGRLLRRDILLPAGPRVRPRHRTWWRLLGRMPVVATTGAVAEEAVGWGSTCGWCCVPCSLRTEVAGGYQACCWLDVCSASTSSPAGKSGDMNTSEHVSFSVMCIWFSSF
jgi:hypothetical protein